MNDIYVEFKFSDDMKVKRFMYPNRPIGVRHNMKRPDICTVYLNGNIADDRVNNWIYRSIVPILDARNNSFNIVSKRIDNVNS